MFRSIPLGRLAGIPLYIHPTFLLLPAWVLFAQGSTLAVALFSLALVLAIFGCVVLHELGHALMARHYGIGTRDITLYPIGGIARLERMSERPTEEIAIALAGPAVNLAIALLLAPFGLCGLFILSSAGELSLGTGSALFIAVQFLTMLWASNIGLLVFNLIPCFPMDGGRVLRALLALKLGHLRATEVAANIALAFALLIGATSFLFNNPMTIVLAVFVALAGQAEVRALRDIAARREERECVAPSPPIQFQPTVLIRRDAPPPAELTPNFSGVTWDRERGVWVEWRNGLPVAFWSGTP
jgi:Zn-dependent protease